MRTLKVSLLIFLIFSIALSCRKSDPEPLKPYEKPKADLGSVVIYRIDSVHFSPYAPGVWHADRDYNIQYITLTSENHGYFHTKIGRPSTKYQIYGNDEIIDFSKNAFEVEITFKNGGKYIFSIKHKNGKEIWESTPYRFYVVRDNQKPLNEPLVFSVDTFVTIGTNWILTCPTHGFGDYIAVFDTNFNDRNYTFYLPNYEWGFRVKKNGDFSFIRNMRLTKDSVIMEYGIRQDPYFYIRKDKKNNRESWNSDYFKVPESSKSYYRYQRLIEVPKGT